MKPNRLLIALLPVVMCITGYAQVFTTVTEIAPTVSATGSANIATADDVWALFINPAGLSRLKGIEVATAFYKPYGLSFFSTQLGAIALPVGKFGTLALGYQGGSSSYHGNLLSTENAYTIAHAFYLQKDLISTLALGYTINLYQVDYGKSAGITGDGSDGLDLGNGFAFGVDLAIAGSLHERSWVALYAKNINSPEMGSAVTRSRLPRSLAVGFGYEPYYGLKTDFTVYQAIGNQKTQYRAGIEYRIAPWLILRTGVNTEPNRIGFGFGLEKFGAMIDYAYISHPVLPETHQFSLGYRFVKK